MKYNAFISYSHAVDGTLAPRLRQSLHRFARRPLQLRALNIFRDEASLSNEPGLWPAIEEALSGSEYFILLASPEAARSVWVNREIETWRAKRPAENILLVVTEGEIAWDGEANDFDREKSTAIPAAMYGAFGEEPRFTDLSWVEDARHLSLNDPRWRDGVADLAATLHDKPKDEMIGEDVLQNRRAKRGARLAITALLLLSVGLAASTWFAFQESARAVANAKEAALQRDEALRRESLVLAAQSRTQTRDGMTADAVRLALQALPRDLQNPDRPYAPEAEAALYEAVHHNTEIMTLKGHEDAVFDIAFSPREEFIATASKDGTVRLWDPDTGETTGVLRGHEGPVNYLRVSPDSRQIVTLSWDDTARIWDSGTASERVRLQALDPVSAHFSPDGGRVVTMGNQSRAIELWDANTGQFVAELGRGAEEESFFYEAPVLFHPQGSRLVVYGTGPSPAIRSVETGEELAVLEGHSAVVLTAALNPDGSVIATGSHDGTARLWGIDGRSLGVLGESGSQVETVAFSEDGQLVLIGHRDGVVRLWNSSLDLEVFRADGRNHCAGERNAYSPDGCPVSRMLLRPDGRRIVVVYYDGTTVLWNTELEDQTPVQLNHPGGVGIAAFHPDGSVLMLTGGSTIPESDPSLTVWSTDNGQLLATLRHPGTLYEAVFGPRSGLIATAAFDGNARVWDHRFPGSDSIELKGHQEYVRALAFSPDGNLLATGSDDRKVIIWDSHTGTARSVLHGHTAWVWSLAFDATGERLVSAGSDHSARLWDSATGQQIAELSGHTGSIDMAVFDAGGSRVLTASRDATVRMWDAFTGEPLTHFMGHGNAVASAAFDPGGARIVSASSDRTARIWDAATGETTAILDGYEWDVVSASFSPDGSRVVTASFDGSVRTWGASDGQPLWTIRAHKNGALGAEFVDGGRQIFSYGWDLTAGLWNSGSGQALARMGREDTAEGLLGRAVISPRMDFVAIALNTDRATLWDPTTAARLATLPSHGAELVTAAFSPDGQRLAIADSKGLVRISRLLPRGQELVDFARQRVRQGSGQTPDAQSED